MEGPATSPPARQKFRPVAKVWPGIQPETQSAIQQDEPPWRFGHELALLAVLFLLAASSRAWLIGHTEVAARDSVGFIRYALELERYPWKEVLERSLQHPGYPMVLLVVSWPVRYFLGGTNAVSMQLSAHDLFGRRAGFWGTALFQCLPVSARVMSDALSEATFLLFMATALLLAVRALRSQSAARFAWCGLFGGLAYLTRPEGALIVVATGLVLIAMQFVSSGQRSWLRVFACATALVVTAAVIASPYVLVTGRLTNKPTPRRLWETAVSEETPKQGRIREYDLQSARFVVPPSGGGELPPAKAGTTNLAGSPPRSQTPVWEQGAGPLTASVLAIYAPESLKDRRLWGLYAIATEVTKDFQYLCVLPLLLGLWKFRDRLKTGGGAWVLLVLCLLHSLVLWRLAVVVGYVSDRHVLVLVLCGVFVAAGGVFVLGELIARGVHRLRSGSTAGSAPFVESGKLSVVLLLTLIGLGLHEALKPLHANRAGHRQAGLWLAEHTELADPVADPFCWAHYYAGRVFWEGLTPPAPPGYVPTQYVVLERSPSRDHSRLPTIDHAKALAASGHVVYHWPVEKTEAEAKILVYAVPPH